MNGYGLINSNNLFILVVAGSILLFIICVSAKCSTMTSKSTLLSKCEKLAILTLSVLHMTIVSLSHLVAKSALGGAFQSPKFSMSLV